MTRSFWYAVGFLAALWLLLQFDWLPAPLAAMGHMVLGLVCWLAFPLMLVSLYAAPNIVYETRDGVRRYWERIGAGRREVEELRRRIRHLDKAHHMVQLGQIYARQGRQQKAIDLFRRALEKEPDSLEAQYRLALCLFDRGRYEDAIPLLEQVHAHKPDHDYGMAYLRLAEVHHRTGGLDRAAEIYETLLRFYPAQPEGSFYYAMLLDGRGEREHASRLLHDMISALKVSPRFQRRRNRHLMLRARWWLIRNGTRYG